MGAWGPAPHAVQFYPDPTSISSAWGLASHMRVAPSAPTPQAGKMRPVSPEKPNPLQDVNICSWLFSW